jgi:hypothetical protein
MDEVGREAEIHRGSFSRKVGGGGGGVERNGFAHIDNSTSAQTQKLTMNDSSFSLPRETS